MFTTIVKVENNRVTKFKEFATREEADSHCKEFGGFVHNGAYFPSLWVDGKTITDVPVPVQVIEPDLRELAIDKMLGYIATQKDAPPEVAFYVNKKTKG